LIYRVLIAAVAGLIASCGYHFVGEGGGAVPAGIDSVSVLGIGETAQPLEAGLRQEFIRSDRYAVGSIEAADQLPSHATVRIERVSSRIVPSAYDQNGLAVQYRITLSGSVSILRQGRVVWQSGTISRSGDLFVAGGPADIEASKLRIIRDLNREWVSSAWNRINSGF